MAEAADFLHIYDVASEFRSVQRIDFFGDLAGLDFAGGGGGADVLYLGISDATYGGLVEFHLMPTASTTSAAAASASASASSSAAVSAAAAVAAPILDVSDLLL